MNTRSLGNLGEQIAAAYLKSHGYSIIEANVRTPFGEVDLLARAKDGTLVFAEVRSRSSTRFGSAKESISRDKLQHMIKSAQYIWQRRFVGQRFRLDLISIDGKAVTGHTRNIELN